MTGETPVPGTLAGITAASIGRNSLSPREFMPARMAALIAVDAPPAPASPTPGRRGQRGHRRRHRRVMIAVAPVVGSARVVLAGGKILRALGFAIAVAGSEMAEDGDAGQ
jgi:hypothetical protein